MAELPVATRRGTGAPAAPRLDSRSPCLHEEMLRGNHQGPPRAAYEDENGGEPGLCLLYGGLAPPLPFWIPAFAGMTVGTPRMTVAVAGTTVGTPRMTLAVAGMTVGTSRMTVAVVGTTMRC